MIGASAITVINNARTMDDAGVGLLLVVIVVVCIAIAALMLRDWLRWRAIFREPSLIARVAMVSQIYGKRGPGMLRDIWERRKS